MASNNCRECGANFDTDAELAAHTTSAHPSSVKGSMSSDLSRGAGAVGAGAAGVTGAAGSAASKVPGTSGASNAAKNAEQNVTGGGTDNNLRDDMSDGRPPLQARGGENEDALRESRDSSSWNQEERDAEEDANRVRRDPKLGTH